MSNAPDSKVGLARVALKRADLNEVVRDDELLRSSKFIKALGAKADALLKLGVARRYPDRAVLFQQGDPGCSLFFVLKGEVRLSGRKGPDTVDLGNVGRGEVFGENEVLSARTARSVAALAHGEVDAAEFPREALLERGVLLKELVGLLGPIKEARLNALSEMTDFMNRW